MAQEKFVLKDSLDMLAAIQLEKTKGIGFFIGINDHGLESVYYFGSAEPGKLLIPDSNSLFEIGPLSATLTTILFSEMCIRGDIKMDDPLQKYLPFDIPAPVYQKIVCQPVKEPENPSGIKDEPAVKFSPYVCLPDPDSKPQPILICYLATHTSGLPALPYNAHSARGKTNLYASYSKDDLYEFLKNYRLLEPIGYDYRYSELGIALLGHVLSLHAHISFDSLLKTKILLPLKLNSTAFVSTRHPGDFVLKGYSTFLKDTPERGYDMFAPAGGMRSTISDMMKFLAANTGTRMTTMKDILDYTHNPRILLQDQKLPDKEIALGWRIRKLNNIEQKVVWQGGSTEGFSSFLGFEESSKCGVVVLSNSNESVEDLGMRILQLLIAR